MSDYVGFSQPLFMLQNGKNTIFQKVKFCDLYLHTFSCDINHQGLFWGHFKARTAFRTTS